MPHAGSGLFGRRRAIDKSKCPWVAGVQTVNPDRREAPKADAPLRFCTPPVLFLLVSPASRKKLFPPVIFLAGFLRV
jgi:hypothetical protein